MRTFLLLLLSIIILQPQVHNAFAQNQNTGIGTTNPQSKLHVNGDVRLDSNVFVPNGKMGIGTLNPLSRLHIYDGSSGVTNFFQPMVIEGGGNTYLNLVTPNANESGILFGNPSHSASGGIVYNNNDFFTGTPFGLQFRTDGNINRMVINRYGSVGIGTTDPNAALDVRRINSNGTANFWGTQNISHFNYGFLEDTYIRAGKNNSSVVINDIPGGKVGVGTAPTITDGIFDVNGRMRVRSGGSPYTAGIWFNNITNNAQVGFTGMEDDTHIGFYGSGTGFKFTMNTQTGALKVNGSEGSSGQILQSNGSSTSPNWVNKPSAISFSNSSVLSLTGSSNSIPIPGIDNLNFSLTQGAALVYTLTADLQATNCNFCGDSNGFITITISTMGFSTQKLFFYNIRNQENETISGSVHRINLPAGSYTVRASLGRYTSGDGDVYTYIGGVQLILQIYPN